LEDFAAHHVVYLELRSTPKILLIKHGLGEKATKRDYVETILATLQEFEQEQKCASSSLLPLTCRFLVAVDRSQSLNDAQEHVDLAVNMAQESEYVVGVDLGGNPTKGDFGSLVQILQRARDAGLKVTLHCAEVSCGQDTPHDSPAEVAARREASAMLDFCPDRLGHALLLSPALQQRLQLLQIPVETCPTSNVMTLELAHVYQGSLLQGLSHHSALEQWLACGHPLAVGTDDPGVFDTNATLELELLAKAFDLTRPQLARLLFQSMEYAFCTETMKHEVQERMKAYNNTT
jgi:adenosine deaminase